MLPFIKYKLTENMGKKGFLKNMYILIPMNVTRYGRGGGEAEYL